jgi:hypothetical protein
MKTFLISLPSSDLFQILDALDSRAESYEYTARHLAGAPDMDDEFCVPGECASAEEAATIAKHFRDVGISIRHQIEPQ